MERGKSGSGRGKSKAQHFPSDLFALGSKSSSTDSSKRSLPAGSSDRKREGPPIQGLPAIKKPKLPIPGPSGLIRPSILTSSSPTLSPGFEAWEGQAVDIEPADLVSTVLDHCQAGQLDKAGGLICGAVKTLRNTKWKPDSVLTVGLVYLAKLRPSLFSLEHVTQALSSLLRRDPQHNFKSKGNPTVAVLGANLLARGYNDSKHWPTTFIKLYVEDAMAERVWVDQHECRGFVNNLLTGFGTKLPPASVQQLVSDIGGPMGGINRSDSPVTVSIEDDDDGPGSTSTFDLMPTIPRFTKTLESVEQIVVELGQVNRRQTPENVTRNYLKLLASAAGVQEMRFLAATRLEIWLQNPKLMKPAQELLLAVCVNCNTHSPKDAQMIGNIVKVRLKSKGLINFYLACLRELINAHPENLATLLKHVIFNELSTSRNPNNMPMIGLVFQHQPEQGATLLAEIYLELLLKSEDYLRTLRVLLREIVRYLRHDINLSAICRGLMADRRDLTNFRDFEYKERMFSSIVDLLAHACFLAVSPAVRESANLSARGDRRELQTLVSFYEMVAGIQQESVLWLKDLAYKLYRPSPQEFARSVHKILFLDQLESYYKVDMWPPESERNLLFRLVAEAPLYENTLIGVLHMGLSKEHPLSGPDALEIVDQLIRRVAALPAENLPMLLASRSDIFDVFLKTTLYHHPDNICLPHGYSPPQLAIGAYYWKAWLNLLVLSAHNPESLGRIAWEKYPTLQMFMIMCITNHFSFPPPTMYQNESSDEWKAQEGRLASRDRVAILEFETHLANASTKATITETTSLLLPQLIAYDPLENARKPPQQVLEQLAALNSSHRLGHLLCRSRHPDFLLDLIQRHGTSQSMPWLADLVENSESSLSHLPVQCLCEFLLTSGPIEKQGKSQQLIMHLHHVLTSPQQDATAPCEVLEYLLRRLSSTHLNSRMQAIKGLKLVLNGSHEEPPLLDYLKESSWLLDRLPKLPHFSVMRPQVVAALRQACQVENDPKCIASYIQFLAANTGCDDLAQMTLLVHDMAQLIVERSTIIGAIMPNNVSPDVLRSNTHHALLLIFCVYLRKAREPRKGKFQLSENQDQVLISWNSGEEATLHILVVHAMIILLCHGPNPEDGLFKEMMEIWFPTEGDLPKGYLVDTSEEALLIPDWLKLKMIRSGNDRLVSAALVDLDVPHLLLFIQSFGIPVSSMSRLLETLDNADRSQMAVGSFDKPYMRQLVLVQRRRGATGGLKFIQDLGISETTPPAATVRSPVSRCTLPYSKEAFSTKAHVQPASISIPLHFSQLFSPFYSSVVRKKALSDLQKILLVDTKTDSDKMQNASLVLHLLMTTVKSTESFRELCRVLEHDPNNSCLALRLVWTQLQPLPESFQLEFASCMVQIRGAMSSNSGTLIDFLNSIGGKTPVKMDSEPVGNPAEMLMRMGDGAKIGKIIDWLVSTEPELVTAESEDQMLSLLFGKPVKLENKEESGSNIETCRPYLLTLLTYRASWVRLHRLVELLLARYNKFYSSTAILDFLEALTRNPRLWQGKERHVPKHHTQEPVLNLTQDQLFTVIEYIIEECENGNTNDEAKTFESLEKRLPLLLGCLDEKLLSEAIKKIADASSDSSLCGKIYKQFLVLIYFKVPGLVKYLFGTDHEKTLKGASISGWSTSCLDKISHSILTALTMTHLYPKDWMKKSQDFELAARKIATVHPSLVLRQLGMLASSLQGRCHLDLKAVRNRNHIAVFAQVLGLIELLEPYVFLKQYQQPLQRVLDAFITLFKGHGHVKEVVHLVPKLLAFLQKYLSHDASAASKFLQTHSNTLLSLQRSYPNMTALRSLLSGVLTTMRDDGGDDEGGQSAVIISTPLELVTQPPAPILTALSKYQGEDLLPTLQDLDHISSRNPVILEVISDQLVDQLLSPFSSVRTIAHILVERLLRHNPQSPALSGYIRSLETDNADVTQSALEKLPEIVVSAQEHAVTLLEKAFSLGVRSSINTSSCINRAISMLNQQSGC